VSDRRYVRLLPAADLRPGQVRALEADGQNVLLCHTGDGIHAVSAICTHATARLDEGRLRGHRLTCLLHGASFDVVTGAVLGGPACEPLRSWPTRIVDGHVEAALDD
jgi:3-phenylpropionate/trans-cinnamate dioxygenase ferredoxin subunit